jgi:hypothetical protein
MKAALLALAFFALAHSATVAYYQQLVPLPSGLSNQNGYTYLKASTMTRLFPSPCPLTADCTSVTSTSLKSKIQTRKIGKFTVSGMSMALDSLSRALDNVAREKPDLYAALGNSGMLCCRAIRGSSTTYSNHAWGAAIDFNIGGVLDPRGDGKTQRGLLELWPYMAAQGFYWAGGYSGSSEDSMHFEIANEVMLNWGGNADYGTCTSSTGAAGRCLDVSQCTATTEAGRCPGPANIKCCFTSGAPPAPKRYKCVTTTTGVNIRAGPCTTQSVLLTAPYNEALEVVNPTPTTGCSYTWYQVRARSSFTGYVASNYVEDCVPSGRNEFNSTIGDSETNETAIFPPGHEDDTPYDGDEMSIAAKNYIMPLFFVIPLFFQWD